ncbi:MAG: FAD-binding and (Fe-S)-binding domain-containing protein [Phycisphaerales bacterium]
MTSMDQLKRELENCHQLTLFVDMHTRGLYATDASIYQVMPMGVVVPQCPEQVPTILKACHRLRIPVLPRGGGTSLAGQCVNEAVVIDVSKHCHRTLECDFERRACQVEAGKTIDDLNDEIHASGLFFAPDPSTARQANIGGCIGNNAAGVHSVLFGRTSENIIAIDACLADGTTVRFGPDSYSCDPTARRITDQVVRVVKEHAQVIRDRFPKTLRRSSGYQLDVILDQLDRADGDAARVNLAPLLCGSEGTLAVTLAAQLKLHHLPTHKGLALVSFDSLDEAIAAVEPILKLKPAGVELLDDLIMDLARGNAQCRSSVDVLPDSSAKAVLFVEFFGDDEGEIESSFSQLRSVLSPCPIKTTTDKNEMAKAWGLRKAGEPLLHAIAGNRKPLGFIEDNAVPVEHLGEFVRRCRMIIEGEGTIASYYAHASVGVLHVRPLLDLHNPDDEQAMHRFADRVANLAQELGGVPSGEHGDGRVRGPFIESYFGSELLGAFREIKSIFDPQGLLNPGNIVSPQPVESISEHTRIKPSGHVIQVPQVETYYRYDADHESESDSESGFGHAVELCNGAGVCRRKHGGLMCPSYQATLDERHSTRGRGNALRLAITGQSNFGAVGAADFLDDSTNETLDLCLSCKGCKSQCPSSVDVAKLKSEYLAQRYQQLGSVPFSIRMMSNIHRLNCLASKMPATVNALNRFVPIRSVIDHAMGIHPKRSLPRFASPVHSSGFYGSGSDRVMILSDTFSTHNDPSVVHATRMVLERFGYDVAVECVSDFGRSAISLGNLTHAIREAKRTFDQLKPILDDPQIIAFVLPEPSCLSVVLDDWNDLHTGIPHETLRSLQARIALPETFLDQHWDRHPEHPKFIEFDSKIHIHGHCHQKALWGTQTSSAIFERLYPQQTHILDTGCCGMAGSFGYAHHRYDLSVRIGELGVFPAMRQAGENDLLIAPGTSCRHQISDGTGRKSIHPIEALAQLLG